MQVTVKMTTVGLCLLLIAALQALSAIALSTPCQLRQTKYGSVCVCTNTYCDYLEQPELLEDQQIVFISSSKTGLRFERTDLNFQNVKFKINDYKEQPASFIADAIVVEQDKAWLHLANSPINGKAKLINLQVKREQRYQSIVSFGGALTGSVSHILQQLPQSLQNHIYRSYFHKDGIAYNTVRMSIGGCDFDLEPWAYNEQPINDPNLSNFTDLDPRDLMKVKQLQQLKTVGNLETLKIMAAAWSAPTWMKTNERWTGFGQLKSAFYQTWANYHLKFVELMQSKNMPIWAISTGNEPLNGIIGFFFVHFMSMGWTPQQQAIWLAEYLGPTIKNSSQSHILIFGNDDQRYSYPRWFRKMNASRSKALDYLDGLAVHWYWDDIFGPELIDAAHADMPQKLILNTESCIGDKPWQTHGPELGSWQRGEQYMRGYLQDLQHHFNGWLDWNLVLDEQGGPNYVANHVDAAVIANTTSRMEIYKQPIFYAIGHFTKFLPEGSVRIETTVSNRELTAVGFQRPDGSIALILYNGEDTPLDVALSDSKHEVAVTVGIPARSWHTVLYQ